VNLRVLLQPNIWVFEGGEMRKTSIYLMALMAVLVWGEFNYAMSAIFTVNNTNDSGAGSLRQAIIAANGNADLSNTINFSATGTILLSSDLTAITKDLTITGPGELSLTINGNGLHRIFNIVSGTVSISGLTIFNGSVSDGTGINNSGTLSLAYVTISDNVASGSVGGGIRNQGTITTMNYVTISNNTAATGGGGIYNTGTITTMMNVIIDGNTALAAGGIMNPGTITSMTNVSIINNTATGSVPWGSGGGIYNTGTITNMTNVTITGNTAVEYGGGYYSGGTPAYINMTNVTIAGNSANHSGGGGGGGISIAAGVVALRSTIIANSFVGGNCVGTITSNGYNLSNDNTCSTSLTGPGDLNLNADILLAPLAKNGGFTFTHALLPGSPAIDKADPATFPPTDQRGVSRPQGAGPDIGAYEAQVTAIPTLSNWGLIVFIVLVGLGSVYYMRRQRTIRN
jgi:predicted outer membrane repeat protein